MYLREVRTATGIAESWVVDIEDAQIIAFEILENGSRRVSHSNVLAGLEIAVLREALEKRRQMDDSQSN